MKRTALACAATAVLYGSAIVAASPEITQDPSQRGSRAQSSTANTVTLTGCLQADEKKSTFWLSDATRAGGEKGQKPSAATGTSGSGGSGGSGAGTSAGRVEEMKAAATAEMYRLNASDTVGLQPHVGHKVQITGTFADDAAGTSGTESRPSGADTREARDKARRVNVTAVKHISPVCEPGKQ